MKKKKITILLAITLSCTVLFSSCIGSFALTNRLLGWNKGVGNKFVNELVFFAFHIVPVYEIAVLADILVVNSIEFWSGNNPAGTSKGNMSRIETEKGIYLVETKADGYSVLKEGSEDILYFVFEEIENSWSIKYEDNTYKLFRYTDNEDEIVMYLPGEKEIIIGLNESGVYAFKQVLENDTYYAIR